MTSPDQAIPFLVLGDNCRTLIAQRLRAVVRECIQGWAGDCDVRVQVETRDEALRSWTDSASWLRRSVHLEPDDEPAIHVSAAPSLLPEIAGMTGESHSGPIASALNADVVESLCQQLGRSLAPGRPARLERCHRSPRDWLQESRWQRWIAVSIQHADRPLAHVALDPRLVGIMAQGQLTDAEGLQRRRAAIRGASIDVGVVLGDADITLAELGELAIGDVLVLNQDLTSSAKLVTSKGTACNVHIGQMREQLAVSIA